MRRDQTFKELMRDPRILSRILSVSIPGMRGVEPKKIKEMWKNGDIVLTSGELVSSDKGVMMLDILYMVRTEDEGWVFLNIEGQVFRKPFLKGAAAYVSKIVDDQRGAPLWEGYEGLRKVYSAWIVFNPHASERNTVIRHRFQPLQDTGTPLMKLQPCDFCEIVTVNIGDPDETESEELRSLDLLFYDDMEEQKRLEGLRTVFKIDANDSILRRAKGMHMNLDEQYIEHWKEIGLEQGIQEGMEKGMQKGIQEGVEQGRAEERRKTVLLLANSVKAVVKYTGLDLDGAISMMGVPADMAEDVKSEITC